jgi:hypothetical protein
MPCESREQKLIDILFQSVLVSTSSSWFKGKSNEEKAKWVAEQLRGCGFNTEPCGSSWGVLVEENTLGPGDWPYSGN